MASWIIRSLDTIISDHAVGVLFCHGHCQMTIHSITKVMQIRSRLGIQITDLSTKIPV